MSRRKNELGKKYGLWRVVSRARTLKRKGKVITRWHCTCACGARAIVRGYTLRSGNSTGCTKCKCGRQAYTEPMAERFAKYCSEPDANGCINWKGGQHSQGKYGVFQDKDNGKVKSAHVVAWELANGPVPTTKPPDGSRRWEVHHKCHNHICVNEDHLQLVTQKENIKLERKPYPRPGSVADRKLDPYKEFEGFRFERLDCTRPNGHCVVQWGWSAEL